MKINRCKATTRCKGVKEVYSTQIGGPIISYKNLLIEFLKRKDVIINNEFHLKGGYTGINYITNNDLIEIQQNWTEKECEEYLKKMNRKDDVSGCPWCIRQGFNSNSIVCEDCGYGIRHGVCTTPDSTYSRIKRAFYCSIRELPRMDKLFKFKNAIVNSLDKLKNIMECSRY